MAMFSFCEDGMFLCHMTVVEASVVFIVSLMMSERHKSLVLRVRLMSSDHSNRFYTTYHIHPFTHTDGRCHFLEKSEV